MSTDANAMDFFFRRVGDAERDACLELLIEHHVRGRLSAAELERRQEAALNASTAAELAGLLADLPRPETVSPRPQPASMGKQPEPAIADYSLLPAGVTEPAKAWARVLGPPAAIGVTAWASVASLTTQVTEEGVWTAAIITGVVGYISRAVASRGKKK